MLLACLRIFSIPIRSRCHNTQPSVQLLHSSISLSVTIVKRTLLLQTFFIQMCEPTSNILINRNGKVEMSFEKRYRFVNS